MKKTKAIKLYPACKNYIWGGDRLIKKYGKKCDDRTCAESWELSFHPDGLTRTADGKTLTEVLPADQLGENCGNFPYFPVLVKLIDAKSDLSVQVHPSDEYADSHGLGYGKTEMWYVVDAEPGACLYIGFNEELDDDKIKKAADDGTLQKYLNKVEVKPGDAFLIPAGTVHAIGAGCLICEIQQNSNITYRLYDYNRKDKNGSKRELHTDQALAVINKSAGVLRCADMKTDDGNILFATKYFTAYKLDINGRRIIKSDKGSFRCITCVSGEGEIDGGIINAGDSFFIPAGEDEYVLSGIVHSQMLYLELIVEFGLLGAVSALLAFAVPSVRASFVLKRCDAASLPARVLAACVSSMAGMALFGLFEYTWFYPRILFGSFLLLGIMKVAARMAEKEANSAQAGSIAEDCRPQTLKRGILVSEAQQ